VAAISTSEILELNPEKTKVRRTTEVKVKENVDDFTIYIESLPPTADHDWLKKIFSVSHSFAQQIRPIY
jgi:La-related protein 7